MTDIAINTLAFHGYPLDTALVEIARLCEYIEPVYIAKYAPALREEYFSANNAGVLRKRLEELRLKVVSMASHMDMGRPDSVAIFKRRMEFAKAIGARMILTNATRRSQETAFYKNMEKLAAYAQKLDLVIALENPGDGQDQLLGNGTEALAVLERLGSDRFRLNYDFCNVFTYSKGMKHPDEELETVLPFVGHLHLKNVRAQEGAWAVCGLGDGIIDYRRLFRQFPALPGVPMSIELPLRFGYNEQFDFMLRPELTMLPLEAISRILKDSLDYLFEALTI